MNNSDKQEFAKLMYGTFEIYDKQITKHLLALWFNAMERYTIEQVRSALSTHISDPEEGRFAPKPANVVKHLSGTEKQSHEQLEGQAQMQWLNVTNAVSRCGTWRSPSFKDPITGAVINSLGGWPWLCNKTTNEMPWTQKEFVKTYMHFVNKPIEELPCHVVGLEEIQEFKGKAKGRPGRSAKGIRKLASKESIMNKQYKAVIEYSNGKWVKYSDMLRDLGLKGKISNTLNQLAGRRDVCCELMTSSDGTVTRYRAYMTTQTSFIDLARYRKSLGLTGAPESFIFGGAA